MREYLSQRWEIEEGDEESVLVDEWYVVVIQLQLHVVEGNMGAVVVSLGKLCSRYNILDQISDSSYTYLQFCFDHNSSQKFWIVLMEVLSPCISCFMPSLILYMYATFFNANFQLVVYQVLSIDKKKHKRLKYHPHSKLCYPSPVIAFSIATGREVILMKQIL